MPILLSRQFLVIGIILQIRNVEHAVYEFIKCIKQRKVIKIE